MKHSLLDDPLISVRRANDSVTAMTLPEILDGLSKSDVIAFEAIQPHQKQAWHCFLTQLAAMAVARETHGVIPTSNSEWRTALIRLAGSSEAAWHLIVEDLSQPAFMQPPVPEATLENFRDNTPTPDQLDVIVATKSHDIKLYRITYPEVEHWVYALINLQQMEGYLGPGNYGISRMNGGTANRPFVGITPDLSPSLWFRRDFRMLLDTRTTTAEKYNYDLNGDALLWLVPWDGEETIGIHSCDPHYIEICRRIRFGVGLKCYHSGSSTYRIKPKHGDGGNGITGDPWAPIDKENNKVYNPSGDKPFGYGKLHDVLFSGKYTKPPSLSWKGEKEVDLRFLVLRTLVRDQGGTEGLQERIVPISGHTAEYFGEGPVAAQIARESERRVREAERMRGVLASAIGAYMQPGDDKLKDREDKKRWKQVAVFDDRVSDFFFDRLWDAPNTAEEEMRTFWHDKLLNAGRRVFEESEWLCSQSATEYWKAKSQATSIFEGMVRNTLTQATEFKDGKQNDD